MGRYRMDLPSLCKTRLKEYRYSHCAVSGVLEDIVNNIIEII